MRGQSETIGRYRVTVYGRGAAVLIAYRGENVFLQGDDAAELCEEIEGWQDEWIVEALLAEYFGGAN